MDERRTDPSARPPAEAPTDTDPAGLEERARAVVEPGAFGYISGGATDELTLADNVAAWDRLRLRPRMLRDVSHVSTVTSVLGHAVSGPVLVAPTAYHRLVHPDGERATALGTAAAGLGLVLSTMSSVSLEDVAAVTPASLRWFQIYVHRDRALTVSLVRRAETAGYGALVVTVDTPRLGQRRRDGAGGYALPAGVRAENLARYGLDASRLADYARTSFDPSLTFEAIEWLCGQSRLPVVVKGILRGDDARDCVAAGAAGVLVSNHGGRQLDGVVATADALPDVVSAVAGRAEVYVDGGVRRGTDVLRALALGARAVLVGRPAVWGLALGGTDGVAAVLGALVADTEAAFALAGVRACADAGADLIA